MRFKQFYENVSMVDTIKQKYKIETVLSNFIGFSEPNQKWYGWSHRAIAGFGIGDECKEGDCAYVPSSKDEFISSLKDEFKTRYYENVDFKEMKHGIKVFYEIHRKDSEPFKTNRIYRFPKVWGKGKWKAKTLDDAKIMATDFAKSVS